MSTEQQIPYTVRAIIGSCQPERHQVARRVADNHGVRLGNAESLEGIDGWIDAELTEHGNTSLVLEASSTLRVAELIGLLTDAEQYPGFSIEKLSLLTVVDASHLLSDIQRDDYQTITGAHENESVHIATAMILVEHIEYATEIVFTNWHHQDHEELHRGLSLASAFNPSARITLWRRSKTRQLAEPRRSAVCQAVDRAGWMQLLNGTYEPHLTDSRLSGFVYHQVMPFHPNRLIRTLNREVETGTYGTVVRSAGFCTFATKQGQLSHWSQVGSMIAFDPIGPNTILEDKPLEDEMMVVGQEISVIGFDLEVDGLRAALDRCVLTADEFIAGPRLWRNLADPIHTPQ